MTQDDPTDVAAGLASFPMMTTFDVPETAVVIGPRPAA